MADLLDLDDPVSPEHGIVQMAALYEPTLARAEKAEAERGHLRDLLARALPHIDPNDSDDALELVRSIEEATR